MALAIIPLVITCIVLLAIIKLMNNMLTFGMKKDVSDKNDDYDEKKSIKIWKIIKVPVYIITTLLFMMICLYPTKIVIVGALCFVMLISFFENENNKQK